MMIKFFGSQAAHLPVLVIWIASGSLACRVFLLFKGWSSCVQNIFFNFKLNSLVKTILNASTLKSNYLHQKYLKI